jgi:hypothetical protein
LPAAWRTLYELTKLTDEQVADGIKTKLINPKMERKAIDDLRVVCRKNKALKLINEELGPLAQALTSSEEITMLCPRRYRATARPTPSAASSATGRVTAKTQDGPLRPRPHMCYETSKMGTVS